MEKNLTDRFVRKQLEILNLDFDEQKSRVLEVDRALSNGSKTGKNGKGFPEFFVYYEKLNVLVIIEDKLSNSNLVKLDNEKNVIMDLDTNAVKDFAVNGAMHYASVIQKESSMYSVIVAIGVTGDERHHRICGYAMTDKGYIPLGYWNSLQTLDENMLAEMINSKVYKKKTKKELEEQSIIEVANKLNEVMTSYGSVQESWKPLLVSGIILALNYNDFRNTYEVVLTGEKGKTDGEKIYDAISSTLERVSSPKQEKITKTLEEFSFIKDDINLNRSHQKLGMTPIKYLVNKIDELVYDTYAKSKFDVLGKFYSSFLKYSSGTDSSALGIVLTPHHITELFAKIADLNQEDSVIDICCGTGGFLVSSMNYIINLIENDYTLSKAEKISKIENVKANQLYGIENKRNLFTIAATNMILRGDGKSNLRYESCFSVDSSEYKENRPTVGMINPPYSLAKKQKDPNLSEWSFILKMMDLLEVNGTGIAIVPLSVAIGDTEYDTNFKKELLQNHTLEAVITMPNELFYPVGTHPCVIVMKSHIPHNEEKRVKFINFSNDGCVKHKTQGRITTVETDDKIQRLVDLYFDRIDADVDEIIKKKLGTIEGLDSFEEEWIHSFHYFDDSPIKEEVIVEKITEYISFKNNSILNGRGYLFEENE